MTPARYLEFEGKMYSSRELEQITGYTRRYINQLVRAGAPIRRKEEHVPLDRSKLHAFCGEELTAVEIAARLGVDVSVVYSRLHRGSPLDAPVQISKSSTRRTLLESGEHEIGEPGNGENGLYWADDLEARIWHMYCGGDAFGECTLDEIAQCWGLSRERVRQVETDAIAKIRARAARGDKDALALQELLMERIELREQRGPSAWEQAALNAPGAIDLAGWERTHSMSELAKRSGREHEVDASAAESAKRGNASAVRSRMEARSV